jgi:hypothetical protein
MFRKHDDAIRIGVRILVVAAVVGLLVLLLQGRAHSAEVLPESTLEVLLEPTLTTPAARVEQAEGILERDRRHRWGSAVRQTLEVAWKTAHRHSVKSLLSGGKGLYRAVRTLRDRSPLERETLAFLDAELRAGVQSEELQAMHAELMERERAEQLSGRLADARRALEAGHIVEARLRMGSLREWGASPGELRRLEEGLSALREQKRGSWESLVRVSEEARGSETALLAALLVGDTERVCGTAISGASGSLLCAAALFESGDRVQGLRLLSEIAERGGQDAGIAYRWLMDPDLNPDRVWSQVRRRDRVKRVLGWIGGERLETRGLDLSPRGFRAWRSAVSPFNLAVSLPIRVLRNRSPGRAEIRRAADFYLQRDPHGPAAREAREWLTQTAPTRAERRRLALYRDGVFELPRARTRYTPVFVRPVFVTAALLAQEAGPGAQSLSTYLEGAGGLILVPDSPGEEASDIELSSVDVLSAVREIARALESGEAKSVRGTSEDALDALRRLDRLAAAGGEIRARRWAPTESPSVRSQLLALTDGNTARLEKVSLRAGDEDLYGERNVFGSSLPALDELVCLDAKKLVQGRIYADIDVDGEARLGVETSIQGASLRVEVSGDGPYASFVVPVGAMLGINRWVPLEASVGVSLTGIIVTPRIDADLYARND